MFVFFLLLFFPPDSLLGMHIISQLITSIHLPNTKINWSIYNRKLNYTITVPNCILALLFAAICYYLTLLLPMPFFYYLSDITNSKEVYSTCFFNPPLEPSTSATGPVDHPFPSNSINDIPDQRSSPKDQYQGPPTVDLWYEILWNQPRGSQGRVRVAIFDRLEPSGQRLSWLFTAEPFHPWDKLHPTEQMVVKGELRTCVIRELMQEASVPGTNQRGVWVGAFPKHNIGWKHFYVKSAGSDIVR